MLGGWCERSGGWQLVRGPASLVLCPDEFAWKDGVDTSSSVGHGGPIISVPRSPRAWEDVPRRSAGGTRRSGCGHRAICRPRDRIFSRANRRSYSATKGNQKGTAALLLARTIHVRWGTLGQRVGGSSQAAPLRGNGLCLRGRKASERKPTGSDCFVDRSVLSTGSLNLVSNL